MSINCMDISMRSVHPDPQLKRDRVVHCFPLPLPMPLQGEVIHIRQFEAATDKPLFAKWIRDRNRQYFLLARITATTLGFERVIWSEQNIL